MTIEEAIEMVRQAGTIGVKDGRVTVGFPDAARALLQPALDFLRSHREETARVLAESTTEPAPASRIESLAEMEPDSPIPESNLPGTLASREPEAQGSPCADPSEHIPPSTIEHQLERAAANQKNASPKAPPPEERRRNLPAPQAPKPRFNGPPLKVVRRTKGQTVVFDGCEWLHAALGAASSTRRQIVELAARGANIQVLQWPEGEVVFSDGQWKDREPPHD